MASNFLGPMPARDFLTEFMACDTSMPKMGVKRLQVESISKGNRFEPDFIAAVNRARLCPRFVFVDTTDKNDTHPPKRYPTISVYKRPYGGSRKADFRLVDLHIVRKTIVEDPFIDPSPSTPRREHMFEITHDRRALRTRRHIVDYTNRQFSSQNRCFAFSVLFLDQYVRFIRWDRAGAIVTERFDWRQDPKTLATFLWNFSQLSDSQRGYDTSVSKPTLEEIKRTKQRLDERAKALARAKGEDEDYARERYSTSDSFRKLCVVDDDPDVEDDKRIQYFVASAPQWQSKELIGRGTRGFEALDLQTGELVYLKDIWRYETAGLEKEGDTYRLLHKNKVSRIPRLVCAGDVKNQTTSTSEFEDEEWCCGRPRPMRHRHYRLVLKDLGRPLSEFNSTRQLCQAVLHAVIAHKEAYEAGVLHNDISEGNILITDEGEGLLIDWELATKLDDEESDTDVQTGRVGTWQFLSAALLMEPEREHELQDDLESFFYIILRQSIYYQRNDIVRTSWVRKFFEELVTGNDGREYGGTMKRDYLVTKNIHFLGEEALREFLSGVHVDLIQGLRALFLPIYIDQDPCEPVAVAGVLESSDGFIKIIQDQLDKKDQWKVGDKSYDIRRDE